jgi:hypothetical protein
MRRVTVAGWTAAALTLTACGGHPAAPHRPGPDVMACQHFQRQREWYRDLATPSLADGAQLAGYVSEDAVIAADPALRRDLGRDSAGMTAVLTGRPVPASARGAAAAIRADCARFGVVITSR